MTKSPFGIGLTSPRHGAAPKIMWASHDNHATMHQPRCLIGRPPSRPSWDLRVPTLFLFNLFLYYYMLMLLSLLRSDRMGACSHSRLGDQMYAPLSPVRIPIPFSSTWTAAPVTDTFRSLFR